MDFLQKLFLGICVTALAFLLAGLYKPWITLWWEHTQNRRKVIRLYGTAALVSYLAYILIKTINTFG